jgi:predicted signal transduction protein with EAL and GGDEF domain
MTDYRLQCLESTFPYHADDMTELLTKADHTLFAAKGAGKDRIKSTNSSDQKPNLNSESATH